MWSLKTPTRETISQVELFDLIKAGRVRNMVNELDPSSGVRHLVGWYTKTADDVSNANASLVAFSVPLDLQFDPAYSMNYEKRAIPGPLIPLTLPTSSGPLILNFLPIILFVGLMYFLFRQQIRMARARSASTPPAPPAQ